MSISRVEVEGLQLSLEKLELHPCDIVRVRTAFQPSDAEKERLRDIVRLAVQSAGVSGVGIVVLGPDIDLSAEAPHG